MECGLGRALGWIDSGLSQVIGLCSTPPCLAGFSLSDAYASWAIQKELYGTVHTWKFCLKFWTCCLIVL